MKNENTSNQEKGKILITGGCGYLGSVLLHHLAGQKQWQGKTIRILDNMQTGGYKALMKLPAGEFEFVEGDILDPRVIRYALKDIDAVVHLAAIVRTPLNFENSNWINQVNRWGTAQLAESCLAAGVKRIIFSSSAVVYGPGGPFREDDPSRPSGTYAQSKFHAEENLLSMQTRGLNVTVLRFGTFYGLAPVMRFEAIVNRFVYLAGTGRALTVYGHGQQQRPIIHVKDAAGAIAYCLEHEDATGGQILNTHGETVSVLDLAALLAQIKPGIDVRYTEQDILTHLTFDIDSSKIHNLGWMPKINLREGIQELYEQFTNVDCVRFDQNGGIHNEFEC